MARMKFRELVAKTMSREAQRRARELAEKDLAELELAELREFVELTQEQLAEKLEVTQAAISRLEKRADIKLSTLAHYIRAAGGKLEIRAVFPGRTVLLSHIAGAKKPGARRVC